MCLQEEAEILVSSIFEDQDLMDFTLESEEGVKFPCHRNVPSPVS